ncbi:MAG: ImmA/IrrE family metallo-endopeptidase [Firmicutes bacterium]|nr:ImmA/IrrE family metallo-endopeptidase [Bacillota bacterium]
MSKKQAKPLSRQKIRDIAYNFRKILGIENELYIDILRILEMILVPMGLDFEIVPVSEMDEEAVTYPQESRIVLREDVYLKAMEGNGRARYTIAHEIGHAIMHLSDRISFARGIEAVPIYMDPEWQADVFAAELLIPKHLVGELDVKEVVSKCGVSNQAARIQLSKYKKTDGKNPIRQGC